MKAIGGQAKRRASRSFIRYLVAICVGVAGTLAWQSYGDEARQTIATTVPELGWNPEVRQMIASWTKARPVPKIPPLDRPRRRLRKQTLRQRRSRQARQPSPLSTRSRRSR